MISRLGKVHLQKESQIFYNKPMVLALLHGRKSRTRRIVRPQPSVIQKHLFSSDYSRFTDGLREYKCPYGGPGDLIYVREAWQRGRTSRGPGVLYAADNAIRCIEGIKVTGKDPRFTEADVYGGPWRSPLHLLKEHSRLWYRISEVLVCRLQQLSDESAQEEGIWREPSAGKKSWACWYDQPEISADYGFNMARHAFANVWNRINSEPRFVKRNPYTNKREECYVSYPWQQYQGIDKYKGLIHYIVGDPYVWDISFEKIDSENSRIGEKSDPRSKAGGEIPVRMSYLV